MKTKLSPLFTICIAAYALNHMEYLRFENHLAQEQNLWHDDKTNIQRARGRTGFHREYTYKLSTLAEVVNLGIFFGQVMGNEKIGIDIEIVVK